MFHDLYTIYLYTSAITQAIGYNSGYRTWSNWICIYIDLPAWVNWLHRCKQVNCKQTMERNYVLVLCNFQHTTKPMASRYIGTTYRYLVIPIVATYSKCAKIDNVAIGPSNVRIWMAPTINSWFFNSYES